MSDPTLPATPIHPGDPGNAANLTLIVEAIRAILQRPTTPGLLYDITGESNGILHVSQDEVLEWVRALTSTGTGPRTVSLSWVDGKFVVDTGEDGDEQRLEASGSGAFLTVASDTPATAAGLGLGRVRGTLDDPQPVQEGDVAGYPIYVQAGGALVTHMTIEVDGEPDGDTIPVRVTLQSMNADGELVDRLVFHSSGETEIPGFIGGADRMRWTGTWDAEVEYLANDVVTVDSTAYVCTNDGTTSEPSAESADWTVLWEPAGSSTVFSPTPPEDPTIGTRWVDTSDTETAFFEYAWWGDPAAWVQLGVFPTAIDDTATDAEHTWSAEKFLAVLAGSGIPTAGTVNDITGGGTPTDDDDYNYLTFDTPGIYELDVAIDGGDYAEVDVFAWGAGGSGGNPAVGGGGAFKSARCKVRAGRYYAVVGAGGDHRTGGAGPGDRPIGWGGLAGNGGYGGQGGGLTGLFRDLVTLAAATLIAGAGGGGGWDSSAYVGGAGGDDVGESGGGPEGGLGGSGVAGTGPGGTAQPPLSGLQGGDPAGHGDGGGGGGGGGGAMGGGPGGNAAGGGGGGGSSMAASDATNVTGESGSGTTPGGDDHALYPGNPVAVGGTSGNDGNRGHLVLRWPKAA